MNPFENQNSKLSKFSIFEYLKDHIKLQILATTNPGQPTRLNEVKNDSYQLVKLRNIVSDLNKLLNGGGRP